MDRICVGVPPGEVKIAFVMFLLIIFIKIVNVGAAVLFCKLYLCK